MSLKKKVSSFSLIIAFYRQSWMKMSKLSLSLSSRDSPSMRSWSLDCHSEKSLMLSQSWKSSARCQGLTSAMLFTLLLENLSRSGWWNDARCEMTDSQTITLQPLSLIQGFMKPSRSLLLSLKRMAHLVICKHYLYLNSLISYHFHLFYSLKISSKRR